MGIPQLVRYRCAAEPQQQKASAKQRFIIFDWPEKTKIILQKVCLNLTADITK